MCPRRIVSRAGWLWKPSVASRSFTLACRGACLNVERISIRSVGPSACQNGLKSVLHRGTHHESRDRSLPSTLAKDADDPAEIGICEAGAARQAEAFLKQILSHHTSPRPAACKNRLQVQRLPDGPCLDV